MRISDLLVPLIAAGFVSVLGAGCGNGGGTSTGTGGSATSGTGGGGGSGGTSAGTGGASAGTGGAVGATGGTPGTGGAIGTGGAKSTGGTTGTGGSGAMTSGCGATPPALGASNPQMISVTDSTGALTQRQFYVSIPSDYDPSKSYRVIFAWHYAGGSAATLAGTGYSGGYYGVQPKLPEAIL